MVVQLISNACCCIDDSSTNPVWWHLRLFSPSQDIPDVDGPIIVFPLDDGASSLFPPTDVFAPISVDVNVIADIVNSSFFIIVVVLQIFCFIPIIDHCRRCGRKKVRIS